ncbi:MAG: DciA family protein [Candidatus Nanopelagicales bacterium]
MADEQLPDLAAEALAKLRRSVRGQRATGSSSGQRGSRSGKRWQPVRDDEYGGAGPGGRDPILVGPGMDDLVRDRDWSASTAVGGVIGRWPEVAGADLAAHVSPEEFDQSTATLRLRAESTAWATQVRMLIPTILARIEQEIGSGVVRDIEVVGPAVGGPRPGRFRVPGRGPRDTYG